MMKNGEEQPKREGERVKKDRRGEGEKDDPRCASYVCARTAQRDSKPPSIRPRDKCVPRRETKRRDDSSSFVKPFSGTNGDDNGEGRRRGRPLPEFETNEISGVKDTSFLHSFFGAASLLKRSTCREGHSSRLAAFRNLPKEISSVGDAESHAWAEYYICVSSVSSSPALATAMAFINNWPKISGERKRWE